jgi:ribosome-associated protein
MATTKTTKPKTTKTKAASKTAAATTAKPRKTSAGTAVVASARKTAVSRGTAGGKTASRTASKSATFGIPKLPKSIAGAVRAAHDKQALDVVILDLRKAEGFTDYFVICTGTNSRQIKAIADAVTDVLRTEFGERPVMAEGVQKSEWILLDYFNFVVHIFSSDCRAFYSLERLWGSAERYECADTE